MLHVIEPRDTTGASPDPRLYPHIFFKAPNNPYVLNYENKMFLTPKGIRSAHKNATSAPSETRTQLIGLISSFRLAWQHLRTFIYRFPNKIQNNAAIYTNLLHGLDMKFREKLFNTAFQIIKCLNRNYVNLAVKLRYPDSLDLRPL